MTNDYFDSYNRLPRNQLARCEAVNAIFDAIVVAFDKLPSVDAINEDRITFVTDTGGVNAFAFTYPIEGYEAGQRFRFIAGHTVTGASTANITGKANVPLGVVPIKRLDGGDTISGDILANQVVEICHDGTNFQLITTPGTSVVAAANSAAAAAASAQTASDKANAASASAASASGSATGAQNSATAAAGSASAANTSAGNASTSEGNAANSAAAAAATYSATASLVTSAQWAVAGGTADAITAAYPVPVTALTDGLVLRFRASATNATTAPTYKADATTAHTVTRFGGQPLAVGDIQKNGDFFVSYNLANTRWEMLNPAVALGVNANKFINGDFGVQERNSSAAQTIAGATTPVWAVDRYFAQLSRVTASGTFGPVANPAPGIPWGIKLAVTAGAGAPGVNDYLHIRHKIEGKDFADACWGTASAQPITISFPIIATRTGTFSLTLRNGASNRTYVAPVTVNAANTYEEKTITIPGDTAGTWAVDNTIGLDLTFCFMAGASAGLTATTNAWQAGAYEAHTGISNFFQANTDYVILCGKMKCEVGSIKTRFVADSYTDNLQKCRRFCYIWRSTGNYDIVCAVQQTGGQGCEGYFPFPTTMRANPSFSYTGTFGYGQGLNVGSANQQFTTFTAAGPGFGYAEKVNGCRLIGNSTGATTGYGWIMAYNVIGATLTFDAEL